jgi:alkyl hydroperoxide reductase subunit AhpC
MFRYASFALVTLALLATYSAQAGGKKEKEFRVQDRLTDDDPKDKRRNGPCKVHIVTMRKGITYQIDMSSRQFDSYLFLEDSSGKQLAFDDDSGGNLDARIVFNCPRTAKYRVVCTAYNEKGRGMFTLTVKQAGKVQVTVSTHAKLLGKAAPDFQADFAVNGKAGKLSDLKDKVVVLAFWEVRSPACAKALPRLSDWHKNFKEKGLEVVGVTFYNSEATHPPVGFDKETGKLTLPKKTTREDDQAMLRDFSAYHKLEHLIVALPYKEAMKAFEDYGVNGLPELVVIDRKGMVRFIRVGEAGATLDSVEAELKKLLEEKGPPPGEGE